MTHTTPPDPPTSSRASGTGGGKRRRPLRIVLISLAVLLLAAAGTAWWLYSDLNGNLKGVDINRALGKDRPEKLPTAGQNVLVLGSDSRAGENGKIAGGNVSGARSDTALVIHIPQGRSRATAVSIPRDTLVTRPECKRKDGSAMPPAKRVMFNSVYSLVGPACVVKTVEQMSDVRIDHYMEIDFAGFKGLVDAIGGVTVDVPQDIHGGASGLELKKGPQKLNGTQSLEFVRTRYGVGDGSDLGRIGLQQQFMLDLLGEVQRQDLLSSPTKSYRIAKSATKSLTTDSELASLKSLAEFARSMKGVNPDTMETIMLPVSYDKVDPNRVVAAEPQARQLWKAIRTDTAVPASAKKSPATGG